MHIGTQGQSSSGDVVYVFMSSFRRQVLKSPRASHALQCMYVSKQNRVSLPFIHSFTHSLTHTKTRRTCGTAGFIFESTFAA